MNTVIKKFCLSLSVCLFVVSAWASDAPQEGHNRTESDSLLNRPVTTDPFVRRIPSLELGDLGLKPFDARPAKERSPDIRKSIDENIFESCDIQSPERLAALKRAIEGLGQNTGTQTSFDQQPLTAEEKARIRAALTSKPTITVVVEAAPAVPVPAKKSCLQWLCCLRAK